MPMHDAPGAPLGERRVHRLYNPCLSAVRAQRHYRLGVTPYRSTTNRGLGHQPDRYGTIWITQQNRSSVAVSWSAAEILVVLLKRFVRDLYDMIQVPINIVFLLDARMNPAYGMT